MTGGLMLADDARGPVRRRSAVLAGCSAVTAGLALAGCSSTSTGAAVPAPPSGGSQQLSPPVEAPVDVTAFGERPCDVFTPEQLAGFGLDRPGEQRTISAGNNEACSWTDSGTNGSLSVITFPDSDILEREYSNRDTYPVFEPIEIAGLPAVLRQNGAGSFRCVVIVGLAEQQGINVDFADRREPYEDPCGAARMAAEVAVGNLPR